MGPHTDTPSDPVDQALKQHHRALWASGDYASIAREIIPSLGPVLVEAVGIAPGERVLDVAAGTGNASFPAAARGATVVASDLTPELLAIGEAEARRRRVDIRFEEADAEALPYADDSFDVAISCVGVMFAPHHATAASELTRVVRPGGRLGLLNWTPQGLVGRLLATAGAYAPPPPPGAQPPPLWGDEAHVRDMLGDRVSDLRLERRMLTVSRFPDPEHFRDYFRDRLGPLMAAYATVADDPARRAELDRAMLALGEDALQDGDDMHWEYLLITARVV